MERRLKVASVTPEEEEEIRLLVSELTKVCNDRIPMILKKKRLENLKKFEITIHAVSLQFGCDEEVAAEMAARQQESENDTNLTYFG